MVQLVEFLLFLLGVIGISWRLAGFVYAREIAGKAAMRKVQEVKDLTVEQVLAEPDSLELEFQKLEEAVEEREANGNGCHHLSLWFRTEYDEQDGYWTITMCNDCEKEIGRYNAEFRAE